MHNFALLYSGQRTVCSPNRNESSTSNCCREAKTTESRIDYGVRPNSAIFCQPKVRFILSLFSGHFSIE